MPQTGIASQDKRSMKSVNATYTSIVTYLIILDFNIKYYEIKWSRACIRT